MAVTPAVGQPRGACFSEGRGGHEQHSATGETREGLLQDRGKQLDCGSLPSWGQEMAHEVDLESFKELEREVILQVLYRDQAVQNVEEERVR